MNHIIMDISVVRMSAKNVLQEGLFLVDLDKDIWCTDPKQAKSFLTPGEAVNVAKGLAQTLDKPPRVFGVEWSGSGVSVTEFKYS